MEHRLERRVRLTRKGDVEDVIAAAEARATALALGDAEELSRLLHEGLRWTTHAGEVFGRSEYIRRNTDGRTAWRSQDLGSAAVVVVGDTAVLHAEVSDVVLSEDHEPETFKMPMTQVWVRLPGGWQCLAGHAGPRRP
ncbi:MAG: nuclear transport factor 2 family protein [Kineosporiaceae bacterium]|nr:nuclear transport factor 2 family protein [Kineosporiaceae bacterium]